MMEYRILGRTGLRVSSISLGCEGFMGKSREQIKAEFDYAIGHGINFVDIYSSNPDLRGGIGHALSGRRESFIIQGHLCTVWEDGQYLRTRDIAKTKESFEQLLDLLGTNYIDVGMIHYIDSYEDFREVFDGEVIKYALSLKDEGKIRSIGVSSHNPTVARMAVETGLVDVLMFSINPAYDLQPPSEEVEDLWADENYAHALQNIAPERRELYELCETKGVAIDVMKVFGGGDILSAERSPFGRALTPVQAVAYALTRPAVAAVMLGCKGIDEIEQALEWCHAGPDKRDYSAVLSGMERFSWEGHCMYCGHCAPCTAGINIASVNKFYNLCESQGSIPETVREHYKALTAHASDCVGCGECETRCPFGVEIIASMQKAAELFGY